MGSRFLMHIGLPGLYVLVGIVYIMEFNCFDCDRKYKDYVYGRC